MTQTEQIMLLSNVVWETAGLTAMNETACNNSQCEYGMYYGRGTLQLTWQTNYENAGAALHGDSSYYSTLDAANKVCDEDAWPTGSWYWNTIVHPLITDSVLSSLDLGVSVKAINGAIECVSPCANSPNNRLTIFNNCLKVVGISGTGTLSSCC